MPAPALAAVSMPDGSVRLPNSFGELGLPDEMVGGAFDPHALWNSQRRLRLERRGSFFHCTQHDAKAFAWDGTLQAAGSQPVIGSSLPSQYIPLRQRRPDAPVRLGRKVVTAFTAMLFGQGRWPQFRSKDSDTQASAEELARVSELAARFVFGRNLGGSCGTTGFSWAFADGLPVVRNHRGENVHVISWADEDAQVPAHVLELRRKPRLAVDPADGQLKTIEFWLRRDWTQQADVVFKPCPVDSEGPPVWEVDEEKTVRHGDGECHFVWVQNLPSEDDTEDGACDYAETFEQQDSLDVLNSVNNKGVALNLDPTLVLSVGPDQKHEIIKKGSDNAIVIEGQGSAEYLQLQDTAIGRETIALNRQQILEVCECVLPDADKVAAAASSGEALKVVYAPMLGRTDVLRLQWGKAIERLVNQMLRSWRRLRETPVELAPANDVEVVDATTEEPVELQPELVVQDLTLEPRTVRELGEDGVEAERTVPFSPGEGSVTVEWGPYFKPTGSDKQLTVGAVAQATGGKPVLSHRAGVELASNLFDRDANDEWAALQDALAEEREQRTMEFGGTGGEVSTDGPVAAMPGGGELDELAPTDKIKAMSVNEVRARGMGLGPMLLPDGSRDPAGDMKWVEFIASLEAKGEAAGAIVGEQAAASVVEDDDLPSPPLPRAE